MFACGYLHNYHGGRPSRSGVDDAEACAAISDADLTATLSGNGRASAIDVSSCELSQLEGGTWRASQGSEEKMVSDGPTTWNQGGFAFDCGADTRARARCVAITNWAHFSHWCRVPACIYGPQRVCSCRGIVDGLAVMARAVCAGPAAWSPCSGASSLVLRGRGGVGCWEWSASLQLQRPADGASRHWLAGSDADAVGPSPLPQRRPPPLAVDCGPTEVNYDLGHPRAACSSARARPQCRLGDADDDAATSRTAFPAADTTDAPGYAVPGPRGRRSAEGTPATDADLTPPDDVPPARRRDEGLTRHGAVTTRTRSDDTMVATSGAAARTSRRPRRRAQRC